MKRQTAIAYPSPKTAIAPPKNQPHSDRIAIEVTIESCYQWFMKEIRFSEHSRLKIDILASRGVIIDFDFVLETVRSPDKLEISEEDKLIAQKRLDENLLLRVVYRDFGSFILIITLYPGRRSRYEKD